MTEHKPKFDDPLFDSSWHTVSVPVLVDALGTSWGGYMEWCDLNISSRIGLVWDFDLDQQNEHYYMFRFYYSDDAVLFKLRWGESE